MRPDGELVASESSCWLLLARGHLQAQGGVCSPQDGSLQICQQLLFPFNKYLSCNTQRATKGAPASEESAAHKRWPVCADRDRKCSRASEEGEITAGGRGWRQAPVASIPESLPGPRCQAEYCLHLISFNPHPPKVWITPFFYRLGNRLRRHEVTCPGTHSCQVTVRCQTPKGILMHLARRPHETDGV